MSNVRCGRGHIVFDININGQARAYPKRILAWSTEMLCFAALAGKAAAVTSGMRWS